jgi:hypothetical protein
MMCHCLCLRARVNEESHLPFLSYHPPSTQRITDHVIVPVPYNMNSRKELLIFHAAAAFT